MENNPDITIFESNLKTILDDLYLEEKVILGNPRLMVIKSSQDNTIRSEKINKRNKATTTH